MVPTIWLAAKYAPRVSFVYAISINHRRTWELSWPSCVCRWGLRETSLALGVNEVGEVGRRRGSKWAALLIGGILTVAVHGMLRNDPRNYPISAPQCHKLLPWQHLTSNVFSLPVLFSLQPVLFLGRIPVRRIRPVPYKTIRFGSDSENEIWTNPHRACEPRGIRTAPNVHSGISARF